MKKLIIFSLSFLFFFIILKSDVSAELLKVSFDSYEKSTEEKVIITSNKDTDDLNLFVAAYLEDNMVSVNKFDISLEKGINVIETGICWDSLKKDTIKLFVWDDSLHPYASYEFMVESPDPSELSLFIIKENREIDYNGNKAYRLSGIHNGKESRIIVFNPTGYGEENPESLTCDDIILISEPNGEGVVSFIKKIDAEKTEGIVTQTPLTFVAGTTYDPFDISYATIGKNTFIADNCDIDSYIGRKVDAYIGNNTIYAIVENESKNSSFTINSTQLCKDNSFYWDAENIIGYTDPDSRIVKQIPLDLNATTLVNYEIKPNVNTTLELAELLSCGGTLEFISNDGDVEIEYIIANSFVDEAVIKNVEFNNGSYMFECYVGNLPQINPEDNTKKTIVYKDGYPSTLSSLTEDVTVSHVQIAENLDMYYVSSTKEEGTIVAYNNMDKLQVTISGMEFYFSPFYNYDFDEILKDAGIFYVNYLGEIAYYKQDSTAMQSYALVTSVYKNLSSNSYYMQAVIENGTVVEYEISKNVRIVDENGRDVLSENTDTQAKAYFNKILSEDGATGGLDATHRLKIADLHSSTPENLLVTIHIGSGKISKIVLPRGTNIFCGLDSKYDSDSSTIGGIKIDKSETKVFILKTPSNIEDFIDVNNIKIGTVLEYFTDGECYDNISLYDKDSSSNFYRFLIAVDIEKPTLDLSSVFVVESVCLIPINNNIGYSVTCVCGPKGFIFTIYNESGYGYEDPSLLQKGDAFIIKELSEDGIIRKYRKIVAYDL